MRPALQRYLKVCFFGASVALLQFALFNGLRLLMPPVWANAIAVEIAIIGNFVLNNLFTFTRQRVFLRRSLRYFFYKLLQFNLLSSGSLLLQSLLLHVGLHIWSRSLLHENMLVLTGIVLGSFLNYFIYTQVIWRSRKH